MAIADSSTTSVETSALEEPNNLEYFDYTSMLTSEIFEIAAIADCARARSFEIDENANVYVTLSLRVILERLEALAAKVDDKCYDYELKPASLSKVGD